MTDLKISLLHTSYPPAEPAPDHALYEPSRTQSFLQGAILGDYIEHPTTSSFLGQVATGFIPGVGQLADLRDTVKAGEDVLAEKPGAWASLGLAAVAWVPGVGDAVKAYAKAPVSVYRAVVDAASSASKWARESASQGLESLLTQTAKISDWFFQPGVKFVDKLDDGALGVTNWNGDIELMRGMSDRETLATFHHEKLHQALSPKFLPGREMREKWVKEGYSRSQLLRYSEEALSESYSRVRMDGLSFDTLRSGLAFPIRNGYVRPLSLLKEAAVAGLYYASQISGARSLGRAVAAWWHQPTSTSDQRTTINDS